jgi:hypothetical protein
MKKSKIVVAVISRVAIPMEDGRRNLFVCCSGLSGFQPFLFRCVVSSGGALC